MTRRIARSTSPCLRSLRAQCNWPGASQRSWALAAPCFAATHAQYATTANAVASLDSLRPPIDYIPPTKPPSARPVETRKSQLIRTYTSLLRTSPLVLFFQHSNLTAVEWAAVRRELKKALEAVPAPIAQPGVEPLNLAPLVQMQVLRTNMFKVALKIVEMWDAEAAAAMKDTPRTSRGPLVHDLSESAYEAVRTAEAPADSAYAQIEPLMVGPLAALVLPAVSPVHVAAALRILSPVPGKFPAPPRRKNPGYHDPICQNGIAKLLLVGGRVEGKVFDQAGVNWVGGIDGGLDGLRAQLVNILQGAGLGITNSLESGSRSLWLALEGRKEQLEEQAKPPVEEGKADEPATEEKKESE